MTKADVAKKIAQDAHGWQFIRVMWWVVINSKKGELLIFLIMTGHDFKDAYPVAKKFKYNGK